MKCDEAFRVAVIPDMRSASLIEISRAWDRARDLVRQILTPLSLGSRLEFGCDPEPDGRGWIVVRIERSRQQALFAELQAADGHGGSPEAASARKLLKTYFAEIREVARQLRVSGYELEEAAKRMLDVAKLHAALAVGTGSGKRVSIRSGATSIEEFALSPLPGRHIHPQVYRVRFWVKLIGLNEAVVILPKPTRTALGARRGKFTLNWDPSTVDEATWEYLEFCMKRRALLEAKVRIAVKSTGALAELIMAGLEDPPAARNHFISVLARETSDAGMAGVLEEAVA